MNTASKIAKESTITFSGLVYGNVNRYLYTVLLARWVGAEFLGIYSMANAIMLIAEVLGKMGLETGVMRFISRLNPEADTEKIQKLIASALKMTIAFSLVIMVGLIISSDFIVTQILNESPLIILVIIFERDFGQVPSQVNIDTIPNQISPSVIICSIPLPTHNRAPPKILLIKCANIPDLSKKIGTIFQSSFLAN